MGARPKSVTQQLHMYNGRREVNLRNLGFQGRDWACLLWCSSHVCRKVLKETKKTKAGREAWSDTLNSTGEDMVRASSLQKMPASPLSGKTQLKKYVTLSESCSYIYTFPCSERVRRMLSFLCFS